MPVWPGKQADTPKLLSNGKTEYIIRTQMPGPCGKKFKGTASAENPQTAYRAANSILNRNVRNHLDKCKKCPPDMYRRMQD